MFLKIYILISAIIFTNYQFTNAMANINFRDLVNSSNDNFEPSESVRYTRQVNNNEQSCEILKTPFHTVYKILEKSEKNYKSGDYVPTLSVLEIYCDKGYNLVPFVNNYSICKNGKWEPSPTICSRSCSSLTSTTTTTVACTYKGHPLDNCINPVDQTIAILSCSPHYEEATLDIDPNRVCKNGSWSYPIPQCYPSCGIKTPKGTPAIINGSIAMRGDYPWQVGVYNMNKELICGGAIIHEHAILSAAHCFADHDGNVFPTANYFIASGKYYREYSDERDELAQYSNVRAIHVPVKYKAGTHFYDNDIAVIILKNPVTFSEVVQPVCVEWNDKNRKVNLALHTKGIVTGWGQTEEGRGLSNVLKQLEVPYIPYEKCYNEVPNDFRRYITSDKICGGYTNSGMSICQGDSGGALSFKSTANNRYYVKGVVSTSPATRELACDSNAYSLYTDISIHIKFVAGLVEYYKTWQPVECIRDCTDQQTKNTKRCMLLNFPPNGKYIVLQQNVSYPSRGYASIGSTLSLSCDDGYQSSSSGLTRSYCTNEGQWIPFPGTCEKIEIRNDYSPDVSKHQNINLLPKECGVYSIKKRIVNGNKADLFEFPWMVLLSYYADGESFSECAGTIINDRYILTAAHCMSSFSQYPLISVRIGEYNLKSEPDCEITGNGISFCAEPTQNITIEEMIPHPNYSIVGKSDDIGLLRLGTSMMFSDSVKPICLPTTEQFKIKNFTNTPLIITGWGVTELGGKSSDELLTANIPFVTNMECEESYNSFKTIKINYKQLCAGGSSADTCTGDAGGPLQATKVVNNDLRYIQVGITSFGRSCGSSYPAVYTRIEYYLDWILDNIRI